MTSPCPLPAARLADGNDRGVDDALFARIATDLVDKGFSIRPGALPTALAAELHDYACSLSPRAFRRAGVGRGNDHTLNTVVRSDDICWISGEDAPCAAWLRWCGELQRFLNRQLFLGLFSLESHFAHYAPGDFYRRHYDAFRGDASRVLSIVLYLNRAWTSHDGGELVLYGDQGDRTGTRVLPLLGTLVVFMSEDFPHEVLPARRDRYSIAGWFRRNTSLTSRVDPPR